MKRVAVVVAILAVLAGIVLVFRAVPVGSWVVNLVERVRGAGARGVAMFAAFYLVAAQVFVPVGILRVAAGFLYGLLPGAALVIPLDALGGFIGFTLARTALRKRIQAAMQKYPRLRSLDAATTTAGFGLVALLRLTPALPFTAVNYALGISRVRTSTFVVASMVGLLPVTFAFLQLGVLLPEVAALKSARLLARSWVVWTTVIATAAVVVLLVVLGRRAARKATRPDA